MSVLGVFETPRGEVWARTSRGLAWYDGYQWHPMSVAEGLPEGPLLAAADDGGQIAAMMGADIFIGDRHGFRRVAESPHAARYLWLVHLGGSRFIIPREDGTCFVLDAGAVRACRPEEKPPARLVGLFGTRSGALWAVTPEGIQRGEQGSWQVRMSFRGLRYSIPCVVEGKSGEAYVQVASPIDARGLWAVPQRGQPVRLSQVDGSLFAGMDVAPSGEILVVGDGGDVDTIRGGVRRPLPSAPLPFADANALSFRENGDLWVSSQSGLYLHSRTSRRWQYWGGSSGEPVDRVNDLLRSADGSIWVGKGEGVEVHRPDGTVNSFDRVGDTLLLAVTGLAEDREGGIWVVSGSGFTGAFRWDGHRWRRYGSAEGLRDDHYHRIGRDRAGRLWFLSVGGDSTEPASEAVSAPIYDRGRFDRWPVPVLKPGARLYAFAEGPDGARWFGSSEGLSRWIDGTWRHWSTADGLRLDRVFCLDVDRNGRPWFGHQSQGLGYLDGDRVRYLSTQDGLVSDSVWDVRIDGDNAVWVGTRGGVSRYLDGTWGTFGGASGIRHRRVWPVLPAEGVVYAGTNGGGTAILKMAEIGSQLPRLIVDRPRVEGDSALVRWQAFAFWEGTESREVQTRYRLGDGEWSVWSPENEQTLTDLVPGDHRFQVQAKDLAGHFDPAGQSVSITIEAPYYRRPAFYVPLILAAATLLVVVTASAVRKRRQDRALLESEARYRSVIDDQTDYIVRFKPDGAVTFVNRSYALASGQPAEALVGSRALPDVPAEERESIFRRIAGLDRENPVFAVELRVPASNGTTRSEHWTYRGIWDERCRLREVQAVGRDTTEAQRAADERRRLESQILATQKLESLGQLAGGIAHDFNNLLTAILGHADLALGELPPDSSARSSLEAVEVAGRRAAELTNQMLVYAGRSPMVARALRIDDVVREVAGLLGVSVSKRCNLVFELDGSVPPVQGDSALIRQTAVNLVSNGSEAIGDTDGTITVRTGSCDCDRACLDQCELGQGLPEGRYAFLEIADTGPGMTPEVRARAFEPFFSTKFMGRGLGLAAVHGIARRHGGAISVKSAAQHGTTVRVYFPIMPGGQAGDALDSPEAGVPVPATVLVVDDEVNVRQLAGAVLKKAGYQVLLASDGREALDLFRQNPLGVSLVLLDATMPRLSGAETFRQMRKIQPSVRVVLTSGYRAEVALLDVPVPDLAGFIQKPYRPAELLDEVRRALSDG